MRKKLRYLPNHQTIYNLLVKPGKGEKKKIISSILNSTLQNCFGLARIFFSKTTTKKKQKKNNFPSTPFQTSRKAMKPFLFFFWLKSLPPCVKTVRRQQDMYRHFSLDK